MTIRSCAASLGSPDCRTSRTSVAPSGKTIPAAWPTSAPSTGSSAGARLQRLGLARLTFDFDGSLVHTQRHAEGSAVGYCKAEKGARSYYPLSCTVVQPARASTSCAGRGNVHASRGAQAFTTACQDHARAIRPDARASGRTLSMAFERFVELKERIEARWRWQRITPGAPAHVYPDAGRLLRGPKETD